ncbi:hypothetical protein IJG01_03725 [Candidatus Saccharibacteria bacterium]|nr:hypothetical protein [Candidatus Saccharibacteria bacterium]
MKDFRKNIVKIYQTERGLMIIMGLNFVISVLLFILAVTHLNPNSAVVKIGYGDIGGYRDGTWVDMMAFPMLAVIFGVFHNLLAVRIFQKRGSGMAKFFLLTTSVLILGAILVLFRLFGEV